MQPPAPLLSPETSSAIEREALGLAKVLLERSRGLRTSAERRDEAQMARLMTDRPGKAFLFAVVDQVFRSRRSGVAACRWRRLLSDYGLPRYPSPLDRLLMRLGAFASSLVPGIVMPAVAARMRRDTARVILDARPAALERYLEQRIAEGFRVNLNHLGEAVLGEEEAQHRLEAMLGHLAAPRIDYISVKISAIFSQINLLAWDGTLEAIQGRLRELFRAAMPLGKFVNLDMEEYRDLALSIAAFCGVLDEPEFLGFAAGIVLQAYLPDSWTAQQEMVAWSGRRVARGGAPIKIRLVKGANLSMEAVEAELHGWNAAPYPTKAETDANFRRMLEFGCRPENAAVAHLGVASHNLFDVALALVLREKRGVQKLVELEMLEGMANHQARAVRERAGGLLLYAPAVGREDFLSALAYLVRRLDENTAAENFLHDIFALEPGTPAWEAQSTRFIAGWRGRDAVGAVSRRGVLPLQPETETFHNEPDTDWTQPANREAVQDAIARWPNAAVREPLVQGLPPLDEVFGTAVAAQPAWEARGASARAQVLRQAALVMAAQRFATLACLRATCKKALAEGDIEVSEAIDFARYYAGWTELASQSLHLVSQPVGVVVVAPPWNFPYSIPCGGVLAALMAGNSVILKPAPEVVPAGRLLAEQLWEAGVPREVLQFFPIDDGVTGRGLITDPRVAAVILTGSYETARMFQQWRPGLRLFAETSGKNAIVITAQADRELAIKDLVKSAFGHAGQKCSAASLAIIEAEVYDSPDFRRQLRDAVASLAVGPATEAASIVTPLVQAPREALQRALTQLDPGEEWLLQPEPRDKTGTLWSPGIKLGIAPGSWFHQTECFGPLLGVMRAESLEEATSRQNATAYGLTAGLHSLGSEEIAWWRDRAQAGNLYINRGITGAVVRRQPFGGWKKSSVGQGAKAGGPNAVGCLRRYADGPSPLDAEVSYREAWEQHFSREHDPSGLRCESNIFRYRPLRGVMLRLAGRDEKLLERAHLAASLTGTPLILSLATEETEEDLAARLSILAADVLRTIEPPSEELLRACHLAGLDWIDAPLTGSGSVELRFWLREQAVAETRHRYGQIPGWEPERAATH